MKPVIKSILLLLSSTFFIFLSSSCNKKNDATPATPTGVLEFHLHTNVDTTEVDSLGATYTLNIGSNAGRNIVVNQAQLLISNIQLIGTNGSVYNVSNKIIHKVQPTEPYVVGNVPAGNYTSVSFTIGLDPTTNATLPVASDSALYDWTLWFAGQGNASSVPTSGYIFFDFEGSIDTTTAKTGTNLTPFKYRIGTNKNAVKVTLPNQAFTVTANQTQFVHMVVNYAAIFNNIKLNNTANLTVNTVSDNTLPVVTTITSNLQTTGAVGARQNFMSYE